MDGDHLGVRGGFRGRRATGQGGLVVRRRRVLLALWARFVVSGDGVDGELWLLRSGVVDVLNGRACVFRLRRLSSGLSLRLYAFLPCSVPIVLCAERAFDVWGRLVAGVDRTRHRETVRGRATVVRRGVGEWWWSWCV